MSFLISPERKAIILPGDASFPVRFPSARPLDFKGKRLWVLDYDLKNVLKLRTLGHAVPSPIGSYYDWPRERTKVPAPFHNQIETAAFLTLNKRAYCLNDIGTGKTLSALWAADYLMSIGLIRKVLFISPLSTLDRVWGDAVFENMQHRSIGILHGTAARRKKVLAQEHDFYVINHDGVDIVCDKTYKTTRIANGDGTFHEHRKLVDVKLLRDDIDLIVIDELAVLRNSRTDRWAYINKALMPNMWCWGLTGTPTPNSPTDAYGQAKLVTPDTVPRYFSAFRQMVEQQLTEYIWVPRKEAPAIVNSVLQPSIRFVRDECFDLPPCTYSAREVEMTAEQDKHYKEIAKELFTEIQGGKITAVNEGVKMGKLLQIACGVVLDKDGIERMVDVKPRISEVLSIIEEAGHKVIVFVPYTAPLKLLHKEVSKKYKAALVYGGVSKTARSTIFAEFQKDPSLRVLVADAGCMSHGLTLTEANTIVWYGPEMSNDIYTQANGRITRPGQKNNQFIIHIESSALEHKLYKRLKDRGSWQNVLLELAAEGTLA